MQPRNRAERRRLATNRHFGEPIGLSLRETGYMICGSTSTVYRLLAERKLRAVKRGAATIVLMDSIRDYLASLPLATFGADRADTSHT